MRRALGGVLPAAAATDLPSAEGGCGQCKSLATPISSCSVQIEPGRARKEDAQSDAPLLLFHWWRVEGGDGDRAVRETGDAPAPPSGAVDAGRWGFAFGGTH